MTLLVALKGADGLVLAADSRGTFGDPSQLTAQNDSQQKAHELSRHVGVLVAGAGEVGALLINEAKAVVDEDELDGVTDVMEALRDTCRQKYEEWFPTVPAIQPPGLVMTGQVAARPGLQLLIAGYEVGEAEDDARDPKIYRLSASLDFSPMLSDYGWAVDGVGQYALYLLNRLYEPDRSVEELTALAVYVITETASQDGKVGGPVNVITIRPREGCRALDESSVDVVVERNQARSQDLRDSFYERAIEPLTEGGDGGG